MTTRITMDELERMAFDQRAAIEVDEHGNGFLTIGRQTWVAAPRDADKAVS